MMEKEILFFEPVLTENIWGGTRFRDEFGYRQAGAKTGECWGISGHPKGDVKIINGKFRDQRLSGVWRSHREIFGNAKGQEFPLLMKMIDAKEDLSIQVHPDEKYANEHEKGSHGKMECWYIVECPPGASLVIGHHAKNKRELSEMILQGRWDELLCEIPVKTGDFIQIDPGTVHAIKGGFLILETQQSSDLTYRLYDYDRIYKGKPRKLHIKESLDVIKVPSPADHMVLQTASMPENRLNQLYAGPYYHIYKMRVRESAHLEQTAAFMMISICAGAGQINGTEIKKGDYFLLPADFGDAEVKGDMLLLAATL